jgi:hypothetical protein
MTDSSVNAPDAEGNKEERRGRGGGLLRWILRAYRAWNNYHRLSSFFASKAGVASVSLGLGAAAIGGVAVLKPDLLWSWLRLGDVTVETERWGDNAIVYPIEGIDSAGRKARFDVVLLQKQFTWLWGSDQALARDSRLLSQAEVAQLFTGDLRQGLARSPEVIAVGVASEEGSQSTESTRAARRSETAARWLTQALPPSIRVAQLNLGQFRSSCATTTDSPDSSWQRPFMMIGVRQQDPGTDIGEALADALKGKTNMPGPDCYSEFKMTKRS